MKKKVRFIVVLGLMCVCWTSGASWPVLGAKGAICLASGGAAKKGEEGKKAEAGKGLVYESDPYLVNLADAGGKRYLKLTMKMELSDGKLQEELSERNFEIRDALIIILSSKEYEDISTVSGKTRLKQEIMVKMNKMIKNGQVKEIFFTDFIVQ